jgi:tetratricopeptide (TPR) repeat protein
MNRTALRFTALTFTALSLTALSLGLVLVPAAQAAPKPGVSPTLYQGQTPAQATTALLDFARTQAAKEGTWERIAVGRVFYLTGKKAEGQEIFDGVLNGKKVDSSDRVRIARVYAEANEWDKAKPLFDRVIADSPKDEDWHAEVGAFYLLNGDRATAEKLFARSFELDPASFRNALRVAGAYAGLAPKE